MSRKWRKGTRRVSCMLLLLVMLVSQMPMSIMADNGQTVASGSEAEEVYVADVSSGIYQGSRYYYDILGTRSYGAQRQALYQFLIGEADRLHSDFTTDYTGENYTTFQLQDFNFPTNEYNTFNLDVLDAVDETIAAFFHDNSQYYFLSGNLALLDNGDYGVEFYKPGDTREYPGIDFHKAADRRAIQDMIDQTFSEYEELTAQAASRYEITRLVYDKIASEWDYSADTFAPGAHDLFGGMGYAQDGIVCEGYSRMMDFILNNLGVPTIFVAGDMIATDGFPAGGHAWNIVQMDDAKYYYVDLTWADNQLTSADNGNLKNPIKYNWFLLGTDNGKFESKHYAGTGSFISAYERPKNMGGADYDYKNIHSDVKFLTDISADRTGEFDLGTQEMPASGQLDIQLSYYDKSLVQGVEYDIQVETPLQVGKNRVWFIGKGAWRGVDFGILTLTPASATPTPTITPIVTPTVTPTATPKPTVTPTATPTATPTPTQPVSSIKLNASSQVLNIGKTFTMKASVLPENVTNKAVQWTTSASKVVKVDTTGKVTAVSAGNAVITATAADGSGITATCSISVLPKTVSSVKVSGTGYNSAKVSWTKVVGAAGYEVYRATSKSGTYTKVTTITSGSTISYTNTGLTTGKTYYYKIRAYAANGTTKVYTGYSSVVSVKPIPAKSTLKVASASYNSIKVTWSKVTGASGYVLYRATSSNGSYSSIGTANSGNKVSYTNKSLSSGKVYYYKIRAFRTVSGKRIYGSTSSVVYTKPIPAAPSTIKAANAGYNGIKVSWSKVTGAAGYQIYRSTSSNGSYTKVGTVTGNSKVSYTNTGLTTGKAYYYKVRAYAKAGSSTVYGSASKAAGAKPLLAKVGGAKAASTGYDRIKVSWTKVAGASGYEIYRASSSTGAYSRVKTVTSGSTVASTITGLGFNKTYYYKVCAYRTIGSSRVYGSYSSVVKAKTALSKVTGTKVTGTTYKSTKLNWSQVSGADGYQIYRAVKGGSYSLIKTITSRTTISYTNTGLTTGKTYYYKVRAYRNGTSKVYGSYSSAVSVKPQFGTVYWVPSGKVFHVNRNCSTLSRSKTIYSGTVSRSGKSNLCKVCG